MLETHMDPSPKVVVNYDFRFGIRLGLRDLAAGCPFHPPRAEIQRPRCHVRFVPQEETSHAWLDYACVATVKVLRDVLTSADRDKRKLLKIAGG
jgi:hypothetical protein